MHKRLFCMLLAVSLLLVACGSDIKDTLSTTESASSSISSMSGDSSISSRSETADEEFSDDALSEETEDSSLEMSGDPSDEPSRDDPSEEPSDEPSDNSSAEPSDKPSDDVSEENSKPTDDPSEEPPEEEEPPKEEPSDEPKEYTSISTINRNLDENNLALRKTYTTSILAHDNYPDDGTKLTDGKVPTSFNAESWAGYTKASSMTLVLDLGKVENDLADFYISTLRNVGYGIGSPSYVLFEISTDGKSYKKIGKAYPPTEMNSTYFCEYRINLNKSVSARYVRLTFGSVDKTWLFLCEIGVVRYEKVVKELQYYSETLPTASTSTYWPMQQQTNTKTNLILNKTPYVASTDLVLTNYATEYYNSILALPLLTDNKYGTNTRYSDPALAHFTSATGRTVSFDIGYLSAISGVKFSFLKENSSGVYPPDTLSVYLSENGIDWQLISTVCPKVDGTAAYCRNEITFDKTYIARYVKFSFTVGSHVFCDELQVFGTTRIPGNAAKLVPTPEEETKKEIGYVTPDQFLGVNNVMLSYHCLPSNGQHGENGLITVEEYLPYVGYYDTNGKLQDTFFDAFLYLPYTSFNYADVSHTLEGWNFYLDDIYYSNRNMNALNQAVSQVKKELSIPNYKCTVFTSILYTWTTLEDGSVNTFGDVDGDGKLDSFASIENRKKAIKWLIDQEYNRFLAQGYDHLTFGGFYWFEEAISFRDDDERALIKFASDYIHSLGLKLFWIPYYCASGYAQWEELGFDVACMQPNYMFGNSASPEVLKITADKTRMLGMCVEIEMNSVSNPDDVRRYFQYLEAGEKYGYMSAVKMYYQGGVPGAFYNAYLSDDPTIRSVYDMTYLFAKEKFVSTPAEYQVLKTEYATGARELKGTKIYEAQGVYVPTLSVSPEHGDLRLNLDGSFTYYPESGFSGVDRFAIYLDYGFSRTEEIVVTIRVD